MTKPSAAVNGGKAFNLKDLPNEFLNPQQFKGIISFTTEDVVKSDQLSQVGFIVDFRYQF